jgi:hypothetical protein
VKGFVSTVTSSRLRQRHKTVTTSFASSGPPEPSWLELRKHFLRFTACVDIVMGNVAMRFLRALNSLNAGRHSIPHKFVSRFPATLSTRNCGNTHGPSSSSRGVLLDDFKKKLVKQLP